MKFATHLDRTSHCRTASGTNLSNSLIYRVFIIHTRRDWILAISQPGLLSPTTRWTTGVSSTCPDEINLKAIPGLDLVTLPPGIRAQQSLRSPPRETRLSFIAELSLRPEPQHLKPKPSKFQTPTYQAPNPKPQTPNSKDQTLTKSWQTLNDSPYALNPNRKKAPSPAGRPHLGGSRARKDP